jgi:DNA-binding transcriptional ArsR family regulator
MSRPLSSESAFRAIAHPSRRRVLELLARREWAACDLAAEFHHAQPTLSRHLRVLEEAGLIQHQRRGKHLVYRLKPGALAIITDWLIRMPASITQTNRIAAVKRA